MGYPNLTDLSRELLRKKLDGRYTPSQALAHSWFSSAAQPQDESPEGKLGRRHQFATVGITDSFMAKIADEEGSDPFHFDVTDVPTKATDAEKKDAPVVITTRRASSPSRVTVRSEIASPLS